MVLHIVPQMFEDDRYECITIKDVYDELTRTTKFKTKYPWVGSLRTRIKSQSSGKTGSAEVTIYHNAIQAIMENGVVDTATDRLFDLSRVDMHIVSFALAFGYYVTSGDGSMIRFLKQEFTDEFKGNISPLGLINIWLEKGLITWDDEKHALMTVWNDSEEHAQPRNEILRFQRLTGRKYPGP